MSEHQHKASEVKAITVTARELSVGQARWVLMPLFGLWIMFSIVGVLTAGIS